MYQISLKDSTEIKNAIKLIDSLKWHSFNYNIDGNKLSVKSFDDFQLIKDLLKTHNITYIEKRSYINLDPTDLIDFKEFIIKLFRNHPNVYEIQYYYTWPELRDWLSKQNKKVGELIKKFNSLKMKKKSDKDYEKFKNWYDETTQKAFGDKSPYDWSIKSEYSNFKPDKIETNIGLYEDEPDMLEKGYWSFFIDFRDEEELQNFYVLVDPDGHIMEFVNDYISDEGLSYFKEKVQQMLENGEIEKEGDNIILKRSIKKKSQNENICPECGVEMFEEEDIEGYSCPECGYNSEGFFDEDEDYLEDNSKVIKRSPMTYEEFMKAGEDELKRKSISQPVKRKGDYGSQLNQGKQIEKEHKDVFKNIKDDVQEDDYLDMTEDEFTEGIAKDHLEEDKNYYTKLKDMEKKSNFDETVCPSCGGTNFDNVPEDDSIKSKSQYDVYVKSGGSYAKSSYKCWDCGYTGHYTSFIKQSTMKQDIENINKQTKEIKNIREDMEDEFKEWHKEDELNISKEPINLDEYDYLLDDDIGYSKVKKEEIGDNEQYSDLYGDKVMDILRKKKQNKDMERKSGFRPNDVVLYKGEKYKIEKIVDESKENDLEQRGMYSIRGIDNPALWGIVGGQELKQIPKQSHKIIETNDPDLDKYAVKDSNGNIVDSGNNLKELQSKYNKTKIATVEDIVEFEDEAVDGNPDLEQPATPAIDIKQSPRVIIQQLLGLLYEQRPDSLTYTSIVEVAEQAGLMDLERYDLISILNEVAVKVGLVRIGWDEYLPEKDIVQEIQDLPSNFESHPTFDEKDFDVNEVMNGYDNEADKLFTLDRILDERLKMFTNTEDVIDQSTDVILKAMKPFQKHLTIVSYKLEDVKASRTDRAGKITHGKVIYNVRLRNSQKGNTQGRYLEKTITVELPIRNGSVESPSKFHYSKKDWPLQPYFVNDLFYSDDEINVKRSGLFEDLGDALNPNNSYDSSRYHLPEHNKERDFLIQTILQHSENYTRKSLENYSNEDLTEIKNDVT